MEDKKTQDNSLYAQAILDMARAKGAVDSTEEGFAGLVKLVSENLDLKKFLQDPTITVTQRLSTALELLKDDKSQTLTAIISMLAIFDKLDEIDEIYQEFKVLVDALKKQVYVEVLSAISLDDATILEVKKSIDKRTGLDVRVRNTVDPSVIGGIIIKIGDRVIDLSLKGKIDDLKRQLKSIELRGDEFGAAHKF